MLGSALSWIGAEGMRPVLGISQTSLSKMLVYSYVNAESYTKSAGFAVLLLGAVLFISAAFGIRTFVALSAVLTLAAGDMWIGLVVHNFNTPDLPNIHYVISANLPWADLRIGAWLTLGGAVLGLGASPFLRARIKTNRA